jgi:Dolichyl-phosphate-mannose-protein mannosyltransferase
VRWRLALAIVIGLLVRVPFWIESLRTPVDADTAIVGLMARHPGEGTTMWGQPYGSPLDAWVATPFVAAMGPTTPALRLPVFLLGLALIPIAWALGRALHPDAAFPAALLLACPPPYFLLLSALPPPFYPTTLVLCGVLLVLAIRLGSRLEKGETPRRGLAVAGTLAGLALWTHLMSASVVAMAAAYWFGLARGRRRLLLVALVPLLIASAPWWGRALLDGQATRIVRVADREQTTLGHLREVVPRLHEPIGGLLGTHVPVVADSEDFVLRSPGGVAGALILIYGALLILAVRHSGAHPPAGLLLATAVLAVIAFPLPVRSGPHTIRFLTPAYLPLAALVAWAFVAANRPRRSLVAVLALAGLHLAAGSKLLETWRTTDRADPPFVLPGLAPVRSALESRGLRHAYASYGPAYRLTWESGERIVASQPWNERFRHYPLPLLDEVRFAKDVAWVLTPSVPTDLPSPKAFEEAMASLGGAWKRTEAGAAVLYHDFVPPFGVTVEAWPDVGAAGDGNLGTALRPETQASTTFELPEPRPLDAVTLVAGLDGPRLLRSVDVETSADGETFETVARRRRREEREDLRWVNGHPQAVLDHDLLAIPLGGRTVAAIRITPYASTDPWTLGELLVHPARPEGERAPWSEWLDPHLGWPERARALAQDRKPDREDWYWRLLLAARHSGRR